MGQEKDRKQRIKEQADAIARGVPGSSVEHLLNSSAVKFDCYGGELRIEPKSCLHFFTKARFAGFPDEGGFSVDIKALQGKAPVLHWFEVVPHKLISDFVNGNKDLLLKLNLSDKEKLKYEDGCALFLYSYEAKTQTLIERSKVLIELLDRNAKREQPLRAFTSTMCGLKQGKKLGPVEIQVTANRIGGPSPDDVKCCTCNDRAHLMASINLTGSGLSKAELTRLGTQKMEVYWCLKCLSDGPVFFDYSGGKFKLLKDTGDLGPVGNSTDARPKDREAVHLILSPRPKGSRPNRGSRVGGPPSWIQDPEVPECIKCGGGMEFLLQLFSDRKFSYGADMGTLFTFVCPKCRIGCYLIQCH